MTVDALGSLCTARAVWRLLTGAGHHGNLVGARQDLVDHQACWDQRQDTFRQGRLSKRLGVLPFDYPLLKRRVDSTQSAGDPDIHCHSYEMLTRPQLGFACAVARAQHPCASWWPAYHEKQTV